MRGRRLRVSIPKELAKRGYWKFIDMLRKAYKEGARVINPEIMHSFIAKASEAVPFPGTLKQRVYYFKYWVDIAVSMGFLEEKPGIRGWILTEKLAEENRRD